MMVLGLTNCALLPTVLLSLRNQGNSGWFPCSLIIAVLHVPCHYFCSDTQILQGGWSPWGVNCRRGMRIFGSAWDRQEIKGHRALLQVLEVWHQKGRMGWGTKLRLQKIDSMVYVFESRKIHAKQGTFVFLIVNLLSMDSSPFKEKMYGAAFCSVKTNSGQGKEKYEEDYWNYSK